MTLSLLLAAACAMLLYLLYRSRMACQRLQAEQLGLLRKYHAQQARSMDTLKAANESLKWASHALSDLRETAREWNAAPESVPAHPKAADSLASAYACLTSCLSGWIAHKQAQGASEREMEDEYIRFNGRGMEDDSDITALFQALARPLPRDLLFFDRTAVRQHL